MKITYFFSKQALSNQLALVITFILLIVITLIGSYNYHRYISNLKENELVNLVAISKSIATAIKEDIYTDNYIAIENKLSGLNDISEISCITVSDNKGLILTEFCRNNTNTLFPTYRYGELENQTVKQTAEYHADYTATIYLPIEFSGNIIALLKLQSSSKRINDSRAYALTDLVISNSITLLITCLTIIVFLKWKLRMLNDLSRFSKQLPNSIGNTIEFKHASYELLELMNSLNWASKEIENQRSQLISQNVTLESKVIERTNAFKKATAIAEKANQAKSEFLSRMSHELRTPLNAILGFGQVLALDGNQLNENQKDNVQEILIAGEHLLMLINEILDLAKIETGKMETTMEPVYVNDVVDQSISLVQPQLKTHDINIINNISAKKYSVLADYTRLKQVLINLLSNAVKYNNDHGSITLEYKIIENKRLRIFVIDTGIGIKNNDIPKLFIPFERFSTDVDGTGIGLVISKHLIELMGGSIGVQSTHGKGTKFWVELALSNINDEAGYD